MSGGDFFCNGLQTNAVEIGKRKVAAARGKLMRERPAYAARRSGYCRCTSLKIKGLHAASAVRLQNSTPQGSLGLRSFCQEIRDEFAGGLRIFFHDPMTGVGNDAAGHVAGDKRQDIHHALA